MMKIIFPLLFLILFSCKEEKKIIPLIQKKVSIEKEVKTWQDGFGLTHNIDLDSVWEKPVRYYVTNKNCDSTALKFYLGVYIPTDEPETERLLHLVTTKNDSLRPFYRWILNKTIIIQDGALGEYTGNPARKYAERYPKEFFEYMDFDKSGEKYSDWTSSIMYSGSYNFENYEDIEKIRQNMIKTMTDNCKNCNDKEKNRIVTFANDCFPNKK